MTRTKKEIIAAKFELAKFMGYTYPDPNNKIFLISLDLHKYDESWDHLIPVGIKISKLGYFVEINSNFRRVNISKSDLGYVNRVPDYNEEFRGNSSLYKDLTEIECVFQAFADFAKWQNKQL